MTDKVVPVEEESVEEEKEAILKGTTESGFAYTINLENLEDYELFELISEVAENPMLTPKIVKKLLGEEQTKKLKDHIRDENGHVSIDQMIQEIGDIMTGQEDLKN